MQSDRPPRADDRPVKRRPRTTASCRREAGRSTPTTGFVELTPENQMLQRGRPHEPREAGHAPPVMRWLNAPRNASRCTEFGDSTPTMGWLKSCPNDTASCCSEAGHKTLSEVDAEPTPGCLKKQAIPLRRWADRSHPRTIALAGRLAKQLRR